jgi:hypothetical protein
MLLRQDIELHQHGSGKWQQRRQQTKQRRLVMIVVVKGEI